MEKGGKGWKTGWKKYPTDTCNVGSSNVGKWSFHGK